jgi:hypothetical protein
MLIERNPTLTSVLVEEDAILADLTSGRCYGLNQTASAVWQELDTPKTPEMIIVALCRSFEIEPEACRTAVDKLIDQWCGLGIVRPVSAVSAASRPPA